MFNVWAYSITSNSGLVKTFLNKVIFFDRWTDGYGQWTTPYLYIVIVNILVALPMRNGFPAQWTLAMKLALHLSAHKPQGIHSGHHRRPYHEAQGLTHRRSSDCNSLKVRSTPVGVKMCQMRSAETLLSCLTQRP